MKEFSRLQVYDPKQQRLELLSNVVYGDIRRRPHPPGLR